MKELLRIPEERKGVLIGKNAKVKKHIESQTDTSIKINDHIEIDGDSLNVIKARDVIHAIGRGFSPEKAFKIFENDYMLEIINLKEWCKTEKSIKTQKGRLIGRKGATRKIIEENAECLMSVYGNTVSVIGKWEAIGIAKRCIGMLLQGKPQGVVYKYLEDQKGAGKVV